MVSVLGLYAVVSSSNPVLTSAQALLPGVPYSTLPRLANSQLVTCCQLRFLVVLSLNWWCAGEPP